MNAQLLGPGKAAEMLSVAPRTIQNWIDSGLLKGYRIPGSKHRRCLREDVLEFAKANGMKVFDEESES